MGSRRLCRLIKAAVPEVGVNLVSSFKIQDSSLFFQIADDLMTVGSSILPARDMNPEIFSVGSLEDELVKVNMAFQPIEPLASCL